MEELLSISRFEEDVGGDDIRSRKLDTDGRCFLCIRVLKLKTDDGGETDEMAEEETTSTTKSKSDEEGQSVSLKTLRRYLKIDIDKLPGNSTSKSTVKNEEEDILVDLCGPCGSIVNKFSKVISTLEMIQIQVNYWLERVHRQIPDEALKKVLNDAPKPPVRTYCRRKKTFETDAEKTFIDELRKEIAIKCSKAQRNLETKVEQDLEDIPNKPSSTIFPITEAEVEPAPLSSPPMSSQESEAELELEREEDNKCIPKSDHEESEQDEEEDDEEMEADLSDFESPTSSPDPLFSTNPVKNSYSTSSTKPMPSIPSTSAINNETTSGDKTDAFMICKFCNVPVLQRFDSLLYHGDTCLKKKKDSTVQEKEVKTEEEEEPHSEVETPLRQTPKGYNKLKCYTFNPTSRKWSCNECRKQYIRAIYVYNHYTRVHLQMRRHKCEVKRCNENFPELENQQKQKRGIIIVKKKVNYQYNPETKKYKCLACPKEFTIAGNASQHFSSFHREGQPLLKCDICNVAEFQLKKSLDRHKTTCQQRLDKEKGKETDPNYKYDCHLCGKKYKCQYLLKYHQKKVHGNGNTKSIMNVSLKHPCDLCEKRFKFQYELKSHKEIVHLGKRPFCKICCKLFNSKVTHMSHERECAKKNPDHPSVLQAKAEKIANKPKPPTPKMEIDMNPETGNFDCPLPTCPKSFTSASSVRIHYSSVHIQVKSHLCDLCGVSFTQLDGLKIHKKKCSRTRGGKGN